MAVLTSSQLTFVDITDQRKLSAYLTSNLTTIQLYNGDDDTYNPSWASTKLTITPQVFLDQDGVELTDTNLTITWKRKDGNSAETDLKTGETTSGKVLNINANNLGNATSSMITYICYVSYYDTDTEQTVNVSAQLTYTLIKMASDAKTCSISGAQVFKYDKDGALVSDAQIPLTATLQNVTITEWEYYDSTSKTYKPYPTTTENDNINSAVLNVLPAHTVFDASNVAKIKLVTSDTDVYDIITIAKLYDGVTGATGSPGQAGAAAYMVMLTNESHIFSGSVDTAKAGSVSTQVVAYQGTTAKTPTIKTVDGKNASSTATATTVSGLTFSVSGTTITFTASTALTQSSGTIPVVVQVDTLTFTKMFSWSVAYTGSGACSLSIESSSQIFKSTDGTNFSPDTITLTPIVQNIELSTVSWKYSVDGGTTWANIANTTASTSNVYYNNSTKVLTVPKGFTGYNATVTSIVFRCISGSYTDSMTIARLSDGQSASAAYTVILSNETQTIATDTSLKPLASIEYSCVVTVYKGSEQLTATTGTVGEGTFKIILPSNPTGLSLAQSTAGTVKFTTATSTAISASGSIQLTIQIESADNTIQKDISYSAAKAGSNGASPVVFQVYAPNGTVFSNQTGNLTVKTVAYYGSTEITSNVTYEWFKYTNGTWNVISGATSSSYTVSGTDVVNIQSYKCEMTYNSKIYTDVITLEDKSDTYLSEMLTVGGTTFKNGQGGSFVYTIVRTNGVEKDKLLGIISTASPTNPTTGMYWYDISSGTSVVLKKYSGSAWLAATGATDKQEFTYTWTLMDKDGNSTDFTDQGKVIYLSCDDVNSIATLQCDVSKA